MHLGTANLTDGRRKYWPIRSPASVEGPKALDDVMGKVSPQGERKKCVYDPFQIFTRLSYFLASYYFEDLVFYCLLMVWLKVGLFDCTNALKTSSLGEFHFGNETNFSE